MRSGALARRSGGAAPAFKKSVTVPDADDWSSRVDCVVAIDDNEFEGGERDFARVYYFHSKDRSVTAAVAMKWVAFATWEAAGIQLGAD